jgi:hypothetical protein
VASTLVPQHLNCGRSCEPRKHEVLGEHGTEPLSKRLPAKANNVLHLVGLNDCRKGGRSRALVHIRMQLSRFLVQNPPYQSTAARNTFNKKRSPVKQNHTFKKALFMSSMDASLGTPKTSYNDVQPSVLEEQFLLIAPM